MPHCVGLGALGACALVAMTTRSLSRLQQNKILKPKNIYFCQQSVVKRKTTDPFLAFQTDYKYILFLKNNFLK